MNSEISFDDMSEPAEQRPAKDGGQPKGGILFLQSPALNSVELSIRATIAQETALQVTTIEFVDSDGVTERKHRSEFADAAPDTPELAQLRTRIHRVLARHAALARSLGSEGTWQQYVDGCRQENMQPLPLADYR